MPPPPSQVQPPPPQMWAATPQQQPPSTGGMQAPQLAAGLDEVRTLWIGDLQYWMDENYLASCFAASGEVSQFELCLDSHAFYFI